MVQHVLDVHEREELIAQGNAAFIELLGRLYASERLPGSGKKQRRHRLRRAQDSVGSERADSVKGTDDDDERGFMSLFDRHAIRATLEEVADLYLNEEKKMVLDFSESRELVALQKPSTIAPLEYTGVRWSLYRSPNRTLAKDQDFCYLEVMKPFTSPSGHRGWAKCSHSIEHRMCPDLSETPVGINRGNLHYCGVFFIETDEPGVLDGIFYYNIARANIPSMIAKVVMKSRGRNNAQLLNHYAKMARLNARQKRSGQSTDGKAALASQLQAERRCGACSDRLPGWKTRAKCVLCKAYMCKKCSLIVQQNYRVRDIGRNHVCFSCAEQHGARVARSDSNQDEASNYLTDTESVTNSLNDFDDGISNATATDEELDDEDVPMLEAGVHPTRRRSSSGSAKNHARPRPLSAHHILSNPAVISPTKHRDQSRTARAATTATASTTDEHTSADGPTLHKVRSVPHLDSAARRLDMHRKRPTQPPAPVLSFHRRRPQSSDRLVGLGSPKGLKLDEVNLRNRSHTADEMPGDSDKQQARARAVTAATYARENPVDLSYLNGFK